MKLAVFFCVVAMCLILGCKNRENVKALHIYCDDVQSPYFLYTYYVNDRGYAVKHGDYFKIRHLKNGYIMVIYKHYVHGSVTTNTLLFSSPPSTNAWITINEHRTTNATVTVRQ